MARLELTKVSTTPGKLLCCSEKCIQSRSPAPACSTLVVLIDLCDECEDIRSIRLCAASLILLLLFFGKYILKAVVLALVELLDPQYVTSARSEAVRAM